jgi:hypothetical protein
MAGVDSGNLNDGGSAWFMLGAGETLTCEMQYGELAWPVRGPYYVFEYTQSKRFHFHRELRPALLPELYWSLSRLSSTA